MSHRALRAAMRRAMKPTARRRALALGRRVIERG